MGQGVHAGYAMSHANGVLLWCQFLGEQGQLAIQLDGLEASIRQQIEANERLLGDLQTYRQLLLSKLCMEMHDMKLSVLLYRSNCRIYCLF